MNDEGRAEAICAFEVAHRAHYWRVVAYFSRRLTDREAARDATSEVFTVAWRRWSAAPPEVLPWLYAIAGNVLRNQTRGVRRLDNLRNRLRSVGEQAADPYDDGLADLGDAWRSLRESDREVLRLAAWEGLNPTELAAALGCSPNTASARLSRARARLRAAWTSEREEIRHG